MFKYPKIFITVFFHLQCFFFKIFTSKMVGHPIHRGQKGESRLLLNSMLALLPNPALALPPIPVAGGLYIV